MQIAIATGSAAQIADIPALTRMDFGYNYTGYRALNRFDAQLEGSNVGLITWPGGNIAEFAPGKYGLNYDGLWNGPEAAGNLPELMALAKESGAGLSIVLPTLRYQDNLAQMRADVTGFMTDLLGGTYGPLPERVILEVGSEFYATFGGQAAASTYGGIAEAMVSTLQGCLSDPAVNLLGADLDIAVQAGRNLAEDELLRDQLSDASLRGIDLVIHHRFSPTATGVDRSADQLDRVLDGWEQDAKAAGGDRPDLFLGTYNVGSYTRDEALRDYLNQMANQGHPIDRSAINLDLRDNVDFEGFYQGQLDLRDYGAQHPRVLLEMMAEYGALGLGAAGTYGSDLQHAGRLSFTDVTGKPVQFIGQEMLDMMAESLPGTHPLQIGLTNDAGDDVWTYAYENEDRLVLFLSANASPPGRVTLDMAGLGDQFRAVWGDRLTAAVPQDWMARFGIRDVAGVDESPESQTFAMGVRSGLQPLQTAEGLTVQLDQPHEVVRLCFAKTTQGAAQISGISQGDAVVLDETMDDDTTRIDLEDRIAGFLTAADLDLPAGQGPAAARLADPATFSAQLEAQEEPTPHHGQADLPEDSPEDAPDLDFGAGAELAFVGVALAALPFLGLVGL